MTALLLVTVLLSAASSEIYQSKDSKGNVLYTDSPPYGAKAVGKKYNRPDRTEIPPADAETLKLKNNRNSATDKKRPYQDIQVTMYMTSWCPYCVKAREYIHSLGVRLAEYDIDKDTKRNDEMLRKSGGRRGVPLIDVEGSIIQGYAPAAIKSAIEEKRRR